MAVGSGETLLAMWSLGDCGWCGLGGSVESWGVLHKSGFGECGVATMVPVGAMACDAVAAFGDLVAGLGGFSYVDVVVGHCDGEFDFFDEVLVDEAVEKVVEE